MILDIAAVVFLVLFTYFAAKKGAAGAALKLGGMVLSILVAFIIYPAVTDIVYMTPVPDAVSGTVEKVLSEKSTENISESLDAMPDLLKRCLENPMQDAVNSVATTLSDAATRLILTIIVFAALVAATKIIIMLLTGAIGLTTKLPVLKEMNSLLGGVCGFAAALVILWVAALFLCAAAPMNEMLAGQVIESRAVQILSMVSPF